ncbi:hypothetical protein [Streptomyces sp. AC555_RSS877]|uniref:hypothetical protein n=1 Tax=Streptomyces sp. AC555_RSS877 TaxID=2823688 RepID=UPI001C27AC06|nr:hypothetical protein [Streptomyces sp. AC555_RSS877]
MSANRPRRRRFTRLASAVAAVALTSGLAAACEPDDFDNSLDCVSDADTISDSLKAIHEAGWDAAEDPSRTNESIDTIEKNLDKINADTDDSKVDKAADELNQAVKDYNQAVLNGDTDPDTGRIDAAADKLKDVCTS